MAKSASGVYEKNEALAGQTVYDPSTGQNVTYNDRGYFESARNPDTTGGSRAQHIDSVLSTDRDQYGGSVYDKTYLSDKALASIDNLRAQAERGEISWAYANWQANLLRSNYGYTGGDRGDQYIPTSTNDFLGIGSGSSGGFSGGSSGSSGGSLSGGSSSASDLSSYLSDMYKNYIQSQLSALESAYKQNLAELEANAEQIPKTYQTARNEAAAQNDLARQSFNEYAAARGLNSGTSGQAALANSAVLQSNMADISTQEANSLSENALQQQKLAIEYQNAAVQAQADGNYQLAQALYGEYVRQDEAAMQAAQLAQSQANWQAEFEASQQQYQDSLAAQQQEYAYDLAMTMLNAGIMPDSSTLSAAGISSADAIAMRLSALSGTSGGGSSGSSGSSGKKSTSTSSGTSSGSQNQIVSINTEELGSAARGLWNIIQQLGDNASAAASRIENYLNNGKITDKEAQILASAFGY